MSTCLSTVLGEINEIMKMFSFFSLIVYLLIMFISESGIKKKLKKIHGIKKRCEGGKEEEKR